MAFCTKCGKQLRDGEFCNCSINKTQFNQDFTYESDKKENIDDQHAERPHDDVKNDPEGVNLDVDKTISSIKTAWISFKNRVGLGEPEVNERECYESGMKIVPESIDGNDDEKPVRQYDLAILRTRLKFMRAEGRMQVTNKRLLFRATGRSIMGRTTLQEEFSIDEISGVEIRNDHRLNIMNLLGCIALVVLLNLLMQAISSNFYYEPRTALCFILAIVLAVPFFVLYKKHALKFISLAVSCTLMGQVFDSTYGALSLISFVLLVIILICLIRTFFAVIFTPNLVVVIKTSGAAGAVEIRRMQLGKNKPEYTGYFEVLPWKDTEKAIIELGAMIDDIQNLGDFGVNKWKED